MERESDSAYFERRAREEREKAEQASDPVGYRVHTDFARAYERRIRTATRGDRARPVRQGAEIPGT